MPKSLDELYEAALAAAEAREQALRKRGLLKNTAPTRLKSVCPAERVIEDEGKLVCRSKRQVSKVKVGPWKAELDSKNVVRRPDALKGIQGNDLRKLDRDLRANRQLTKECDAVRKAPSKQTFANPGAALQALYSANPGLGEAIGRIWGSKIDSAYNDWLKKGRVGPRPTLMSVYGSNDTSNLPAIDFMETFTDRAGRKRKIYSVMEALYASTPASRRWDDWMPVLEALQEEINRHAAEDDYIQPWYEIKVPGRAGAALEKHRMQKAACATYQPKAAAEIIAEYKKGKKEKPDVGRETMREPGVDNDDSDIPF